MSVTGPRNMYDFSLFDEVDVDALKITLNDICKKYNFRRNGNKIEGWISLKVKKRQPELAKILNSKGWVNYSIDIVTNKDKKIFSNMKKGMDIDKTYTNDNNSRLTKDVQKIEKLRPWQSKLRTILSKYDERTVDIVYDPVGNSGKSTLAKYMIVNDDVELLPNINCYKDIMRMAYSVGEKKIYLVDMPRAIKKTQLEEFFAGIETLKSGYCFDDRYTFKRRLIDRPRICVFTNTMPNLKLLSKDMWKIWTIKGNKLVAYSKDMFKPKLRDDIEQIEIVLRDDKRINMKFSETTTIEDIVSFLTDKDVKDTEE